ncbi:RND family transporter [Natrialbaceae archaeon GCM10025810]|uniref:efflux RND transporter permease subunit n=1 Tax=Halovalidus salilacus TaxID=3075124 RepID=UPI003615B3D2
MSLPDRIADALMGHTRAVLVALLLLTALVGAGMPMVDDDSSLDQFESESPEAQALEEIQENYSVEEDENTTTVQVITRADGDGNVLSRESLIASLEFQQAVKSDESIDETLVENDSIVGVENVVAMTAITEERAAELEARAADLEERRAELNATNETLVTGIDEVRDLQREYDELNATADEDDPEYEEEAARIEAEMDATVEESISAADLTEEQAAEYEAAVEDARAIESQLYAIEAEAEEAGEDPSERAEYRELQEQLEGVYAAGTTGVLEEEYEDLEAAGADLEERQDELRDRDGDRPSLDEQIEALEELDEEEYEETLTTVLSDDDGGSNGGSALSFMPTGYEPGSTEADARMTAITQSTESESVEAMGGVDERIVESQLEVREIANDREQSYLVFGAGLITDEIDRSMADSLAIVGPLALLFVVATLLVAYRDPLDIVLGVAGIVAVLVWTFGFMGWAGIAFNQMFVAIPVLLIGLSIDYAIHVFMRHREQREAPSASEKRTGSDATREQREAGAGADSVRGSMAVALAGVGAALVWVTATTVIGFLSNLVSPIGPIREFGVVSSFGIVAALIVFGALIPAAKVEIDSFLEARGFDRRKRAFGTGENRFSDALAAGAVAARKVPLIVLVATLLLTAGGVYGATQVDTSFEQEDFLAESPPAWTERLPDAMSPGDYQAKNDLEYVNEHFQRDDSQAQILVRGDVTDDETLERVAEAQDEAAESDVVYTLPTGEADVQGPLSTMEDVAAENESFDESFREADTDGDGVPDENVEALYDELYEVDEEAARQVIHRTEDGEYRSTRLVVSISGDAAFDETTDEMREIAAGIEGDDGGGDGGGPLEAVATGDPIVSYIVEQDLLETVLESLLITLVAVFAFLSVAYWLTGNGATLGAITLLPVAFSVSWILGTMYLIEMPFNVLTGMITSLTVGLGVAYSIHVSARYTLELERQGNVWTAMRTTVTGTGGALLGSAATTIGGFGTLALAILPVLRQFGIITALTIAYAFLASVIVLPTLLVLWTRFFGPDVSFDAPPTGQPAPTASDGGTEGATDADADDSAGGGEDR